MVDVMRDCWDEERVTRAPDSRLASATQYPMPEVPPMMRTWVFVSLELYFWESGILGKGGLGGVRKEMG